MDNTRHLTIVVCGAGPATEIATAIEAAQATGWTVNAIATPAAMSFLDTAALEDLTGQPVRSQPRDPNTRRARDIRPANAFLVAPATYNTVCKLALGIADTYALTVLAEAVGSQTPVVMVPFVNSALASRLPYRNALTALRTEGVRVIAGEHDDWEPHPPGTGGLQQQRFPWLKALTTAAELAHQRYPADLG